MITLERMSMRHASNPLLASLPIKPKDAKSSGGRTKPVDDYRPSPSTLRKLGATALLGWSALAGLSAWPPALMNPAIAAPVQHVVQATVPAPVRHFMVDMMDDDNPDEASHYGTLYEINMQGQGQVLALRDQTSPQGNNVPGEAVVNHRVVAEIEGIGGDQAESTARFHHLMQNDDPAYLNVHQPIIGIHEGTPAIFQTDLVKMAREANWLKTLQANEPMPDSSEVYAVDPSVKTVHDIVKQQLDQDHSVLLVPYSGGGMVGSLALNLLHYEGYGPQIGEHVRVLSLAGVSSPEDYETAGVTPQNILYVADPQDVMGDFGKQYLPPGHLMRNIVTIGSDVLHTGKDVFNAEPFHSTDHIFARNMVNGHQTIDDFVKGGPGGLKIR